MNSFLNRSSSQRLDLDRNTFSRLAGGSRVCVQSGMVWLTVDGEPDDHLLRRGEELSLPRGAKALVQALDAPSQVLVRTAPGRVAVWLDALRHAARSLQRAIAPRVQLL